MENVYGLAQVKSASMVYGIYRDLAHIGFELTL